MVRIICIHFRCQLHIFVDRTVHTVIIVNIIAVIIIIITCNYSNKYHKFFFQCVKLLDLTIFFAL